MQRIEAFGAAEHARRGVARERRERLDRDVERGLDGAAKRAPQVVDDGAFRFVTNVARDRLVGAVRDVLGERFGDGHSELQFD